MKPDLKKHKYFFWQKIINKTYPYLYLYLYNIRMPTYARDIDVRLKNEDGKAVIQGKTTVPFQTFVQLVLQRKVLSLFKEWGKEPLIVSSDLLTGLASAPQDSHENRSNLVLVTLGVGIVVGVFVSSVASIFLQSAGITLGVLEHFLIAGGILALGILTSILGRIRSKGKRSDKLTEKMEKMADLLAR
jgi:hypothetical protein